MQENQSVLYSEYIIDGVHQDLSPARMLDACMAAGDAPQAFGSDSFEPVVDETMDPDITPLRLDIARLDDYCDAVSGPLVERVFPVFFPLGYTRFRIADALISCIWKEGHFRLGDLSLALSWGWNDKSLGNMACFHSSVCAAADFIDMMGLKVAAYSYDDAGTLTFNASVSLNESSESSDDGADDFFGELPFTTEHPSISSQDRIPFTLRPDASSWIIYVPFDQSEYRLGGSLLCQKYGLTGKGSSRAIDPDYFIDCYEVVRELVEDKVAISGTTVGDGGLAAALYRMSSEGVGADIDVADLVKGTGVNDPLKVLFAEVPGVLFQISDSDYDYVDAELLLQDVAFYPLGHPDTSSDRVRVRSSVKSGIQAILESIISSGGMN